MRTRASYRYKKGRAVIATDPVAMIMSKPMIVGEHTMLDTVRSSLRDNQADVVVVVDRERAVVGVLTIGDLNDVELDGDGLAAGTMAPGHHFESWPRLARDVMTPVAFVVHEYTTIRRAAQLVVAHHLAQVPVLDRAGHLAGIVSALDVLHRVVERNRGEVVA